MGDDAIRARFQALEGRPVSELTAKLGAPETDQEIAGERWYAWSWKMGDLNCRLSAQVAGGTVVKLRPLGNRGPCDQMSRMLQ